jgi:hypothetical protein
MSPEEVALIEATAHETVDQATDILVEAVPIPAPIKEPIDTVLDYVFKSLVTLAIVGLGGKKTLSSLKNSPPGKIFG